MLTGVKRFMTKVDMMVLKHSVVVVAAKVKVGEEAEVAKGKEAMVGVLDVVETQNGENVYHN